ncbi:amidoligase family protein [Roseovarius sp. EGI FJ00037]|uniref:amidoligase family protein n=1 Tax=Roseovarius TaxID=74030 RepID=UPI0022A8A557|nr:amidoligase family protein [Roseovarius sp. EGI FJ00037]MCZ0813880.1 amidoligase family protein [Roseovarius sp. EGI FJ00037]
MTAPRFTPLPRPDNAKGAPRKIGVEIELGGLDEGEVARICAEVLGGRAEQGDGTLWIVHDTRIGRIEVYLDTSLRKAARSKLRDLALDLGREVIPVEIVTAPLDMAGLEELHALTAALRRAGALGSGAGWVFGFGMHLNIEIASRRNADILRPLLAYALIEDWLRHAGPIDESRRLLPFTDPYPTSFVRALLGLGMDASLREVIAVYLEHTPSRNRGLDMLPIFAHLAPGSVKDTLSGSVSARPAFHFRLPDCLIDEPGWSIAHEWERWVTVERIAEDERLLTRLGAAWLDDHGMVTFSRASWAERCGALLHQAGLDMPEPEHR